jgi:hypothetical protein
VKKKRLIGAAVAGVAVAGVVGGGALAVAASDDDDTNVTGPDADQAIEAALAETGAGTATSVEREDEGGVTWEVEITKADGTSVEVDLDASYGVVASEADDDGPAGQDDDTDSAETDDGSGEADDDPGTTTG